MNASPPLFQPVHPALLWPFQKSLEMVCKQSCHPYWWGAATGPLRAGWVTGDMVFLFTEQWHYSPTQRQLSRVWVCHWHIHRERKRERWWRRYVTLLQTVQIEAHYVARLAMQKKKERWLKANGNDWTRPGLPFSLKWTNLRGIDGKTSIWANNNSDVHLLY